MRLLRPLTGCLMTAALACAPSPDAAVGADAVSGDAGTRANGEPLLDAEGLMLPPGPPFTYDRHVHAIYRQHCAGCHTDEDGDGACAGKMCFVDDPEMLGGPACCPPGKEFGVCKPGVTPIADMTFAACTVARMRRTWQSLETHDGGPTLLNGEPILVPETQMRIVEYWVASGRP